MTTLQHKQDIPESRFKELQVENELLLLQLHQLQEELEHYFVRNQDLEKEQQIKLNGSKAIGVDRVDYEFSDTLAENLRLHALVEVQQKVHQLEAINALNVKLGNILIQGVDSPGNLLGVPRKIGKIWRQSSRKKHPKALGEKNFDKLIAAFSDGGFKTVEKLLAGLSLVPTIQANAYTALARHLMNSNPAATAEAARRAYELEPQPFRLKWLAFRLHEAGDVIEAEAMLDTLPIDTKFSDSETRQASQLRNEAKHVRQHEAKQKTRLSEHRVEIEIKFEQLMQAKVSKEEENELLLLQLHQAQEELELQYLQCQTLNQVQFKLEQEKNLLAGQKGEQAKDISDCQTQIKHLMQAKVSKEEENEVLLLQLLQARDEHENQYLKCQSLEQVQLKLEQEKKLLVDQKDEQVKLAEDRQVQIEQLTQARVALESERVNEIEALKQTQEKLEQEKKLLAVQKDEQVKLAEDRKAQIERLTQAKIAVESERVKEIESLKQTQEKLEQEKKVLVVQKDEQVTLAEDRLRKIDEMQQVVQALQVSEAELSARQQMMHDEMVRSEAQIDLIKDMFLRDTGL